MRKQRLILGLFFLSIIGFMIWLSSHNEKKQTFTPIPEEKVKIKEPAEVITPEDYQVNQGKG